MVNETGSIGCLPFYQEIRKTEECKVHFMTKKFIYQLIKPHTLAVISTCSKACKPEAALIAIAVTKDLEIIFDTSNTSRKFLNMKENPLVALVIGWKGETTLQYEGYAVPLIGDESNSLREIYFDTHEEGRQRADTWPDLVHFKIVPTWIRYSNFNKPGIIEEWTRIT
jgi:general stress protein 26